MKKVVSISFLIMSIFLPMVDSFAAEINVYSSRNEAYIKPLLDRFTRISNIPVRLHTQNANSLFNRLEKESLNSNADLLLTTDAGRLQYAYQQGFLQAVKSKKLDMAIPEEFRHPDGFWYGLSIRARPIFYAKSKIKVKELSSYEALADKKWQNRICIRSSKHVYNQSLVASLIARNGMEETQNWANNFIKNLARKPTGGDRDQIKAVASGICDIAIANSYYYGSMIHNKNEKQYADKVGLFWPNQKSQGTHVNISGIGMTKSAKNKSGAQALMEFLVTQESQDWYAQVNHEYPVIISGQWSGTLKGWGYFNFDPINTSQLGELNDSAMQIMQKAHWE